MTLSIIGIIIFIIGFSIAKINSQYARFKSIIKISGIIVFLFGAASSTIKIMNPGEVGVQILFGHIQERFLEEGMNFVNPFVDVKVFNIKTLNYTMSGTHDEGQKAGDDAIRILSKDGLEVAIDMTVLYKIMPKNAPDILRKIGIDFEDKVIRPIIRTRIRESAVNYNAIELYSTKREIFEGNIKTSIQKDLSERGFELEQILVRKTMLPNSVKESIERKINADQESQRMKFVLEKEQQEAERKRVEARGVSDAQKILSQNLTDKVLQYEMIKVQKELATSHNSKIIVLGNSKGSMPFILGDGK